VVLNVVGDSRRSGVRPVLVLAALLLVSSGLVVRTAGPAHAAGPASYTITRLTAPAGETFTATDSANPVNGAGLVAGYVGDPRTGVLEAAVFDTRTSSVRRLGSLVPGRGSFARDVNIRGDVVGSAGVSANVDHAFVVRAGTTKMIDLGPADPAVRSDAFSVNDHGEVAGWLDDSASSNPKRYAVTWTPGAGTTYTTVNIGRAVGSTASRATAVNNGGYVLFSRSDKGVTWSFVWIPEHHYALQIRALPGDDDIFMEDMNDAGVAVGTSSARKNDVTTPVLWDSQSQTLHRLSYRQGTTTRPVSINAHSTVVGNEVTVKGEDLTIRPVVWSGPGADVAYLPFTSGLGANAFGINVFGLVVGADGSQGEVGTSVVWKPVTQTSTR
jgi:uncharacterized membrane protein